MAIFFLLLFIYFDFLAALIILNAQHHESGWPSDLSRFDSTKKKRKIIIKIENNQRKIKNTAEPKQHENGLGKRLDDVSKIGGVEFSVACEICCFVANHQNHKRNEEKAAKKKPCADCIKKCLIL